jgi:mannosyltransferase OCH1-like enzyme
MLIYNSNTPVLFVIFNRLDTAQKVFDKIKRAKPERLYIAADGPRNEKEAVTCNNVRNTIIAQIDWGCSLKTLFRAENLGCKKSVSGAITWFFKQEPEGIILEDDCLPSDSFFGFCSQLLEKYRYDERIGHISGSNDQSGMKRGDGSYYFSSLTGIWGWAGWRRVWKDYDINMDSYPLFEQLNYLEIMPSHAPFKQYWKHKFRTHYQDKNLDSWSFQYAYLNLISNRLSINPNVNLISNIGCASFEASHLDANNPAANRALEEMEELCAPSFITPDVVADITAQKFEFSLPTLKKSSTDGFLFIKEKLAGCANRNRNNETDIKIPKIIHQVWDNRDELPNALQEIAKTWKDFHPEWEYKLWNKAMIDEFLTLHFPDFIPYYKAYLHDLQRWFAVRYLILYHYGGLYVDIDYECLEPLDTLFGASTCCMGMEPGENSMYFNKPVVVGNAFMASIPRHNYFGKIIEDLKVNNNKTFSPHTIYQIMESAGPFLTTRVHNVYPDKDEITLIPAELVTPLTLNEIRIFLNGNETPEMEDKIEKAFAIHYFLQTWKN